jgi:chromosome partitioning protein
MSIKTVAYVSLKGGTGKSSLTILTANYAAATGKKVLVIDLDLQNSASFYYHPEEIAAGRNIAAALQQAIPLNDAVVPTIKHNVSLLPSSLNLADVRAIDEKRLARLLPALQDDYDLIIIDTPPTYDNIVLNGIRAAERIYTPLNTSQFDVKSALFIRDKLELDVPDKLGAWQPVVNNLNRSHLTSDSCITAQYLGLIRSSFIELADYEIPSRIGIKKNIDADEGLKLTPNDAFSAALYVHMTAIVGPHTMPEEL